MATFSGVGRSTRRDPKAAAREAAEAACRGLGGAPATFALVFATSRYDQGALMAALQEALPGATLSGCSGEGIIAGPVSDESDHAVAVMALHSDRLDFQAFVVEGFGADPRSAGAALAGQIDGALRGDEIGMLLFPDGLLGNCAELFEELEKVLPPTIPIVGGTAGDALTFDHTFQYRNDRVVTGGVSAVLIRGEGELEIAVSHGCRPIGVQHRVTRAERGWIQEIDDQPAWSVFREYLEGNPEDLNAEGVLHLSIGEPLPSNTEGGPEEFVIRTPMGLDKSNGALFFPGGGIAGGDGIRLTRRDPAKICDSARACARSIVDRRPGRSPALVMQFDCAGRGYQLFGSAVAEQIIHPLQEELGSQIPWVGFHTYGEIAPINGRTYYHNFTVALCALYDKE